MPIERIGYRRLYDSLGCSLSNQDELNFNANIGNVEIVVYMGSEPKRGIVVYSNSGKYIVPGEISPMGNVEYQKDASLSSYPRKFFTEIQCIKRIEISQELSSAFHKSEPNAHSKILELANKDIREFKETADLVAGVIGLRFHRQFVLEAINENLFVIKNDNDWAFNITGQWAEMLEEISLNPMGTEALSKILSELDKAPISAREFGMSIFGWMLRAWVERDPISKFMALFIPLEIILSGYGRDDASDKEKEKQIGYDKIRDLISEQSGEDIEFLLKLFKGLVQSQRPSLSSRFEQLANEAKLDGYENHIVAFRLFNAIRNKMLHQGNPNVKLEISISEENMEEKTQQLGDLVERYVSWTLFRDKIVYPSRWRKSHS